MTCSSIDILLQPSYKELHCRYPMQRLCSNKSECRRNTAAFVRNRVCELILRTKSGVWAYPQQGTFLPDPTCTPSPSYQQVSKTKCEQISRIFSCKEGCKARAKWNSPSGPPYWTPRY